MSNDSNRMTTGCKWMIVQLQPLFYSWVSISTNNILLSKVILVNHNMCSLHNTDSKNCFAKDLCSVQNGCLYIASTVQTSSFFESVKAISKLLSILTNKCTDSVYIIWDNASEVIIPFASIHSIPISSGKFHLANHSIS